MLFVLFLLALFAAVLTSFKTLAFMLHHAAIVASKNSSYRDVTAEINIGCFLNAISWTATVGLYLNLG